MGRMIHFEIHVKDMDRAKAFYKNVFGWVFEDYSDYAGVPYFGVITGNEEDPGINGALMLRQGEPVEKGQPLNGYVCTMGVEDYDKIEKRILDHGGVVALKKHALPGMAWQGYYLDTEGNVFGIHQPDEQAK